LVFTLPTDSQLTFQTQPQEGSALKRQNTISRLPEGASPLKRLKAMSKDKEGGRKRQNKYYM
jgi:hypothetical protein